MKISDAIKRLSFTISKQNKPNLNDADALNSIIEFVNNSNKQVIKENELTAKLFCFILKEFAFHYKDVNLASKQINKDILSKPLLYHIEFLRNYLNKIEIDNFLNDKENNTNAEMFKESFEVWDSDNTIANFEMNFNLALNTYKNV